MTKPVLYYFLANLAIGVVSAAPANCMTEPAIVIGAGMSGMAAARELVARGCNVTILEGDDRIGGRTISENDTFGEPIDLHAGFIHGGSNRNSVKWLTEVFGIETFPSGGNSAFRGLPVAKWVRPNGVELTEAEIQKGNDLLDRWYDTEALNLAQAYENSQLLDTVLKYVELQAIELMRTGNGNTATIENEFDEALLDYHLTSYFDTDWGLSRWQHSVNGFSTDWDFVEYPDEDRTIPDGVGAVIQALLDDLDNPLYPGDSELELNAVVKKVQYDENGCTVEMENGDEYTSGACIVTIPILVMKDKPDLFEPELPSDKIRAIDRTGVAGLNKLFVKWKTKFWDAPTYYIVGGDKTNPFSPVFHDGQLYGRTDSRITQHFFGGNDFGYCGENNLNTVKNAVVEVMQGLFGDKVVKRQDIEEILCTNHRANPFSRGSYSAPRVYEEGNLDRQRLADPIGNTLFFAGEHTNTDGRYQTMDGAYDTGVRAAGELCAADQNINVVSQRFVHKNPNQPGNRNIRRG